MDLMTLQTIGTAGSLVAGHFAGKVLDAVGAQLRGGLLNRVAKRRGERFFAAFCHEMAELLEGDIPNDEEVWGYVNRQLDILLQSESAQEALYDACRGLVVARSHDLGPRLLAVLTARIIAGDGVATEAEEDMLTASEALTDEELREFAAFVEKHEARLASGAKDTRLEGAIGIEVDLESRSIDSNLHGETNVQVSPLDVREYLGRWASRAKAHGLVTDSVGERTYDYGTSHYVDEPGTVREVTHKVHIADWARQYAALVLKVDRSAQSGPQRQG